MNHCAKFDAASLSSAEKSVTVQIHTQKTNKYVSLYIFHQYPNTVNILCLRAGLFVRFWASAGAMINFAHCYWYLTS